MNLFEYVEVSLFCSKCTKNDECRTGQICDTVHQGVYKDKGTCVNVHEGRCINLIALLFHWPKFWFSLVYYILYNEYKRSEFSLFSQVSGRLLFLCRVVRKKDKSWHLNELNDAFRFIKDFCQAGHWGKDKSWFMLLATNDKFVFKMFKIEQKVSEYETLYKNIGTIGKFSMRSLKWNLCCLGETKIVFLLIRQKQKVMKCFVLFDF